jgi:NADPH:quinone reductase-like Zn-dependent oxidoreductase
VASGGGWLANWLKGKRVACGLQEDRDGTWAEYVLANATECIPLKRQVDLEQAASLIVNPLTAMGLLATAQRAGHRAAVHTAGASQLGRMLLAMAREAKYTIVNVVRRKEQVELLLSLGAEHVLNCSDDDFADQLTATCQRTGATAAFEAVAGDMTGTVLNAMPPGSTVYVYGALSEEACGNIDPIEVIFRNKSVTGFYLGEWARQRGPFATLRVAGRVQRMLATGLVQTKIQGRFGCDDFVDGLQQYLNNMTDGKVLLMPHGI